MILANPLPRLAALEQRVAKLEEKHAALEEQHAALLHAFKDEVFAAPFHPDYPATAPPAKKPRRKKD